MQIDYDLSGMHKLASILNKSILQKGLNKSLSNIGAMLQSSAENRMSTTNIAPDGTPWAEWSPKYAKTRHSGQKKLFNKGNLNKDLSYQVDKADVIIGSMLPYARIHQLGGMAGRNKNVLIPARQYLGISIFDEKNMYETLKADLYKSLEANLG